MERGERGGGERREDGEREESKQDKITVLTLVENLYITVNFVCVTHVELLCGDYVLLVHRIQTFIILQ